MYSIFQDDITIRSSTQHVCGAVVRCSPLTSRLLLPHLEKKAIFAVRVLVSGSERGLLRLKWVKRKKSKQDEKRSLKWYIFRQNLIPFGQSIFEEHTLYYIKLIKECNKCITVVHNSNFHYDSSFSRLISASYCFRR